MGEVWFIDAEIRQILMDRRRAGGYVEEIITAAQVRSEVLPGFRLNASWLWATPLPNRFMCLEEILRGT